MPAEFKQIGPQEMQERFRASGYQEAFDRGELVSDVIYCEDPGPLAPPELPEGTKSQRVIWWDRRNPPRKKVVVHQYVKPDGSLGASGKPDPKWLYQDGVIYALEDPEKAAERERLQRIWDL